MSFSSLGSTSSFASCELGGAKARTARIVLPADLRSAGAVADAAGGATFGSSELRASAHVEDGVLTVSVNGSGEVPDSLLRVLGKQPAGKPMTTRPLRLMVWARAGAGMPAARIAPPRRVRRSIAAMFLSLNGDLPLQMGA
jgi:hypothetical protein